MSKYYDGSRLLNTKQPLLFNIGNRSTGKSHYWLRYILREAKNKGKKFMYIRRYVNELDEIDNLFGNVLAVENTKNNSSLKGYLVV